MDLQIMTITKKALKQAEAKAGHYLLSSTCSIPGQWRMCVDFTITSQAREPTEYGIKKKNSKSA